MAPIRERQVIKEEIVVFHRTDGLGKEYWIKKTYRGFNK